MDRFLLKVCLCFGCIALLPLTGCNAIKQVEQVFGNRPSQNMPAYKPVQVHYEDQNWTSQQRTWFYHAAQGAELLPYKWFLALEQPKLTLFHPAPRFADPDYLAGFGFLPDPASPQNPDGLPVGFAKDDVRDPQTGTPLQVVGLTCSACHTGQLEYQGKGVRIDGGTASAELAAFQTELGFAAAFTDKLPFRFDRFAKNVLGDNASSEDKKNLRDQLRAFLKVGLAEAQAAEDGNLYAAVGGFGRTDALGRIGNYVFGTELSPKNLVVANAPVKFPPLWDTSWFSWVQYDYSIQQPMVRNIGEALGVRARVNLTDPAKLYSNTVNVKNLWLMEEQLAGPTAFHGLAPPKWPADIFGPLDPVKVQQGATLYQQHCQRCHLPPLDSPALQDNQFWEQGLAGRRFLKLKTLPLQVIGTDPNEAEDWSKRQADTGVLGKGTVPATVGLQLVTTEIRDRAYDAMNLSPEQRMEWNGYRGDGVTAPLVYRARPLAGIWATPPFLHNGSVPNLYELLLPANQRSKEFYTGSRSFDPVRVGYQREAFPGAFGFHTDAVGNSNAGHEFNNTPGKGVIGPELTDAERWALIEYLKSL